MKEATILISSLLTPSDNLEHEKHFQRLTASTMMSIVYDYPTVMSEHDPAVEKIEKYNHRLSNTPGSYLVDVFPWMKYIPERSDSWPFFVVSSWILTDANRFAKWKREGLRGFAEDSEMFIGFLNLVKVDLVRICLKCDIRSSINRQQRPMGVTGQVFARQ
jgi:hypothetical protein